MSGEAVRSGKVVTLKYVLCDENGVELERADADAYVHGKTSIPHGLERALGGRNVGERFQVTVTPADGFGIQKRSVGEQPVPRSTFPADVDLIAGMQFSAEGPGGQPITLYITRVTSRDVFVDTNHPFAGRTLHYDVEVTAIRDATADERRTGVVAS